RIIGFICGSLNTGKVYRDFLRRAGPRALLRLLPRLFSVRRFIRALETLLYPNQAATQQLPQSEVLNFCVSSSAQGGGVGRALFGALVTEFRCRDVAAIRIVTGGHQRSAQGFYEAAGARRAG